MNARILELLKAQFPDALELAGEYLGELTVVVRKGEIVPVCRFLRDDPALRFDSIRDVCGADYYRPEHRYEVVYNLYSIPHKARLRLKVRVEESDLRVPTVCAVWTGANWMERETYDMYGIVFDGHPDLRRIYLPEEFEYYPLRKDFPLMGIPGSLPLPRK
jgi:NADH-quinone oxidoreductase subunit C